MSDTGDTTNIQKVHERDEDDYTLGRLRAAEIALKGEGL